MKGKQSSTASPRVFISSVTREFERDLHPDTNENIARFAHFRSALARYIHRFDCDAKTQENFFQSGDVDTLEKLAHYIRTCVAVVHLVGCHPGDRPNDLCRQRFLGNKNLLGDKDFMQDHPNLQIALGDYSDMSFTQWEAFQALHFNIPLLIYSTDDAAQHQRAHIERLSLLNKHAEAFATREELVGKLFGDLRQYVASIPELKTGYNYEDWLKENANPAAIAGSLRSVRNMLAGVLLAACVIIALMVSVFSGLLGNNKGQPVDNGTEQLGSVLLDASGSSDIDSLAGASEFDATAILQNCTSTALQRIGHAPRLSDEDRWRFVKIFKSVAEKNGAEGLQLTKELATSLRGSDPNRTMSTAATCDNPLIQSLATEFQSDSQTLFHIIQVMIEDE